VHGYLSRSLCTALMMDCVAVAGTSMAINYGVDVRGSQRPSQWARGSAPLCAASLERLERGAQAVIRVTVEADAQAKPVCVADVVVRYGT